MNVKNNARAKESIEKIKNSLKYFISEGYSLNKISIQKLCEKAGIYRATFYAHFDIIDDVLFLIQQEALLKSFAILHDKTLPLKSRVIKVVDLLDDGKFTKQLFLNIGNSDLKISEILSKNDVFSKLKAEKKEQFLIINSMISAITGVLKLYYLDKNKYSKEEIINVITHIISINKETFPV